jgi:hypothetical protein
MVPVKRSVRQASATGCNMCKMQLPVRMLTEAIGGLKHDLARRGDSAASMSSLLPICRLPA